MVGNRLRLLRKQYNIKQTDLVKVLGVKEATISKYEAGLVSMTEESLIKAADFFNVSIDYILGRSEDTSKETEEKLDNDRELEKNYKERKKKIEHSNRIKLLREKEGLTQTELGEKLEVSEQTVGSWENNISEPNIDTLIKLSKIFQVTVDYILGLSDFCSNDVKEISNNNKEKIPQPKKYYVGADEVTKYLDCEKNKAYEMIRELRQELIDAGKLTSAYPRGKVPKKYFMERCMIEE